MVLSLVEIESMRRSAAMSSLSLDDQRNLLSACAEMARERERIAAALGRLPTSWQEVRKVLNECIASCGDARRLAVGDL